jgi:hypothetical protein
MKTRVRLGKTGTVLLSIAISISAFLLLSYPLESIPTFNVGIWNFIRIIVAGLNLAIWIALVVYFSLKQDKANQGSIVSKTLVT